MANATLPASDRNAALRQAELDRTAFAADPSLTLARTCGIRWQGDADDAAIDDVDEFEFCFPGLPATHEVAKAQAKAVLADPTHRWHSDFRDADRWAERRFRESVAADRADYAGEAHSAAQAAFGGW